MPKRIEVESDEQWHAMRSMTIGASESSAIMGLNPWESRTSLYLRKTGQTPPSPTNSRMDWGNKLEPLVLDWFTEYTNIPSKANGKTLYLHDDFDFISCTPDGMTEDDSCGIEIKTASGFGVQKWDMGVPEYYYCQVQHQMMIMDHWKMVYVPVLLNGSEPRVYEIQRDEPFIDWLRDSVVEFWAMIEAGIAPDMDGSEVTAKALAAAYSPVPDKEAEIGFDAPSLIADRAVLVDQIKTLEAAKGSIENQLKQELGDATVGMYEGKKVCTWKVQESSRLDIQGLRAAHPDLAAKFTSKSSIRVLRVY